MNKKEWGLVVFVVLYFIIANLGMAAREKKLKQLQIERTQLEIKTLKGQCK